MKLHQLTDKWQHKERAGEPALSKPSYGIIFGNRLIVAQLVKLDV